MYAGEQPTALDDKGRITVSARFRQIASVLKHSDWYLTAGFNGSLLLLPHGECERIRAAVQEQAILSPKAAHFRRLFFGRMTEVAPDGQGRIPISPAQREYAGLNKDVVVVGAERYLEVWAKDRWDAYVAQQDAQYEQLAEEFCAHPAAGGTPTVEGAMPC